MGERLQFDLVAIGGGFAGLCAALRGAELGLRTAIVEAGTDDGYLCSSRWAGGIFHVSYHDVKLSPDELIAAINRQTGGDARCGNNCFREDRGQRAPDEPSVPLRR